MPPGENVLTAALAAGIPLPYSCRAGRCATCKARLLAGAIEYPGGKLPPGIVESEASRGEVLLCQAHPRSDLRVQARTPGGGTAQPIAAVIAKRATPLAAGGMRITFDFVGAASVLARPGQFVDIETATGTRERAPVVAVGTGSIDVEAHDLDPDSVVRMAGPFDGLR